MIPLLVLFATQSSTWSINSAGTLIWNGEPYMPVGARIADDPKLVEQAASSGIKDLLIETSVTSSRLVETINKAEELGQTYSIIFTSLAPNCSGWAIEPGAYRVQDITTKTTIKSHIPSCQEALFILANQRSGAITSKELVKLDAGTFLKDVDGQFGQEHVALLYPKVADVRSVDAWEGCDRHRDEILALLSKLPKTPGLRMVFDPLGALPKFQTTSDLLVPESARYQLALEQFLKEKYGSVKRAEVAWGINASDLEDLAEMSRLVPLWSDRRGLPYFYNPTKNDFLRVDMQGSAALADIGVITRGAIHKRLRNISVLMSSRLRVPIIQSWADWNGPYSSDQSGLNGIAVPISGDSVSQLIANASRAASTLRRWRAPNLLIASSVEIPDSSERQPLMEAAVLDSARLGVRGWFARTETEAQRTWIAGLAQKLKADRSWTDAKTELLPFPEAAANPAQPMEISSGLWWVPSPDAGTRLDYGKNFGGYQISGPDGRYFSIWANGAPRKVKLLLDNPKNAVLEFADHHEAKAKIGNKFIEIELSNVPLKVSGTEDMPIPSEAADDLVAEFGRIEKMLPSGARTSLEELIFFKQAQAKFKVTPAPAYYTMSQLLNRLKRIVGPVLWIEGELGRNHNFSEVEAITGASNGQALTLRSRVFPLNGLYKVNYPVQPKFEGPQSVWMAVRAEPAPSMTVSILGQDYRLSANGISEYGPGFRWFKVADVNMPRQTVDIGVQVDAPYYGRFSIDCMVLMPEGVSPSGITLPWWP